MLLVVEDGENIIEIVYVDKGKDMTNLKAKEYKKFEDIRHVRKDESEYWGVGEFADVLDYSQCHNFQKVINRAMIVCENSGYETE